MRSKKESVKKPSLCLLATEGGRAILEYGVFRAGKPLLKKAPRGDKQPVLVLPGFMTTDRSTRALRGFLDDIGYTTYPWELGRNFGDYRYVLELVNRIEEISRLHNNVKVNVIGWSLGGVYAREVARLVPDKIKQVITLGSPFGGLTEENNVSWLYGLISGKTVKDLDPKLIKDILITPPVPVTAIYSKYDGIVSWKYCMEKETSDIVQNIEVKGSHCGLGHNVAVLSCIANRLAQTEKTWKPFKPSWLNRRMYPNYSLG